MKIDEDNDDFSTQFTPVRKELKVPVGHIVVSGRWRNSELINSLQGHVNLLYEDGLGIVDFHPASHVGVVYITEADLITTNGYKRKLAKLRKADQIQVTLVAEKTPTSSQFYPILQRFCILDLGFVLIPVPGQREAAGILVQMVHAESKLETNPFCKVRKTPLVDLTLLQTVQCIPKLGEVKARLLLEKFQSIQSIGDATVEQLAEVIGKANAHHVKKFFE